MEGTGANPGRVIVFHGWLHFRSFQPGRSLHSEISLIELNMTTFAGEKFIAIKSHGVTKSHKLMARQAADAEFGASMIFQQRGAKVRSADS